MSKDLIIAGLSFGMFIVCPRMAGMAHVIHKYSSVSLVQTVLFGVLVSLPILILMVILFPHIGVYGALAIAVATDLIAATLMKQISLKAGLETMVIALFVVVGVKVAPLITKLFIK